MQALPQIERTADITPWLAAGPPMLTAISAEWLADRVMHSANFGALNRELVTLRLLRESRAS